MTEKRDGERLHSKATLKPSKDVWKIGLEGWLEWTQSKHRYYLVDKLLTSSSQIEHIWQMLYRTNFYRGGPVLMSALSGVDIALWDLKGMFDVQ